MKDRLGLMEVISRDLRRGAKNLNHDNQRPDRDSNRALLEFDSRWVLLRPPVRYVAWYIGICIHLQTRINVENAILSVISGFAWKTIKTLKVML
jgi:hypothetical protein